VFIAVGNKVLYKSKEIIGIAFHLTSKSRLISDAFAIVKQKTAKIHSNVEL